MKIGEKEFTLRELTSNLVHDIEYTLTGVIVQRITSDSWTKDGKLLEKLPEEVLKYIEDDDWDYLSPEEWYVVMLKFLKADNKVMYSESTPQGFVEKRTDHKFEFEDYISMPDDITADIKKKLKEKLKVSSLSKRVMRTYSSSIRGLSYAIEVNREKTQPESPDLKKAPDTGKA